jgi:hypothetical protein
VCWLSCQVERARAKAAASIERHTRDLEATLQQSLSRAVAARR